MTQLNPTHQLVPESSLIYHTSRDLYEDRGVFHLSGVYDLIGPDKSYFPMLDITKIDRDAANQQKRLIQRVHERKSLPEGFRSTYQISTFHFDGKPFMVTQEIGPQGEADFKVVITDAGIHTEAVEFMKSFYYQYVSYEVEIPIGPLKLQKLFNPPLTVKSIIRGHFGPYTNN